MKRRFRFVSLSISALCIALHWWADNTPVTGGIVHRPDQSAASRWAAPLLRGIHFLEGRATDLQFLVRGRRRPHPDAVVAVVDEKSAQRFGRWPWPRGLIARALMQLHQAGARAVGLDVMFLDEVDQAAAEGDRELASAIEQMPELVLGVLAYPKKDMAQFSTRLAEQAQALAPHLLRQTFGKIPGSVFSRPLDQIKGWQNFSAQTPIPSLALPGKHLAHLNAVPDPDATLRRTPVLAKLEHPAGFLPNLEVQAAALYFDARLEPVLDPDLSRLTAVRLQRQTKAPLEIPLQALEPYSLINYPGPGSVFKTVSLSDVADGKFDPADISGKAVLVGVTLVGEFDQRVTPFSEIEPGIFSHASFLSNILSGNFLTRPAWLRLLEIMFILVAGILLVEGLPRARSSIKLLGALAVAIIWLLASQTLFSHGLKVATAVPLLSLLVQSFVVIFLGYVSVDAEKARLRDAFRYYLNENVMEQMLRHPEQLKLGGEKREMTVLFADIRGFTTLSEQMAPETLVKFINSFLTPVTRVIFEEGGTLDKYIGDAVMAFWGAPTQQEDHALRGCRAALRILDVLSQLNLNFRSQGLPEIEIGIGISTGSMVVGNMGSEIRFNYTVMGDAVNVAARLEAANKEHGTRLLVSESTYSAVKDSLAAQLIGSIKVRGRQAPVRAYELRASSESAAAALKPAG